MAEAKKKTGRRPMLGVTLQYLNMRAEPAVIAELEAHIDGVRFHSRSDILRVALREWLDRQKAAKD